MTIRPAHCPSFRVLGSLRAALSGAAFAAALAAAALALTACGAEVRPAAAGEAASTDGAEAEEEAADADVGPAAASPSAKPAAAVCVPGSSRECLFYYTEPSGRTHCPVAAQLCREDGAGWLACGRYKVDANGAVVPRG